MLLEAGLCADPLGFKRSPHLYSRSKRGAMGREGGEGKEKWREREVKRKMEKREGKASINKGIGASGSPSTGTTLRSLTKWRICAVLGIRRL